MEEVCPPIKNTRRTSPGWGSKRSAGGTMSLADLNRWFDDENARFFGKQRVRAPCCNRVCKVYELGEDWFCTRCKMGDWDAPPIEAPAAAKAIWEAAYAEPPDAGETAGHAPPSEKSEQLWGPDCQQSSEPEAEAPAEARTMATQGLEQASGMEHGEEELEKPAEDPAGKAANPNEPAPYPWRQAQYQRCSPAKRRRLSTLDHGVLISWHRHFGSGGTFESDAFPARSRMAPFFIFFSRTSPRFRAFPVL